MVVEKYLEIDDFVEYIFKDGDYFMELEDAEPKDEEEQEQSVHSSASELDEEQKRI